MVIRCSMNDAMCLLMCACKFVDAHKVLCTQNNFNSFLCLERFAGYTIKLFYLESSNKKTQRKNSVCLTIFPYTQDHYHFLWTHQVSLHELVYMYQKSGWYSTTGLDCPAILKNPGEIHACAGWMTSQAWYFTEAKKAIASMPPGHCLGAPYQWENALVPFSALSKTKHTIQAWLPCIVVPLVICHCSW